LWFVGDEVTRLTTPKWSYHRIIHITSKMPKCLCLARSYIANLGEYIPKAKKQGRLKADKENVCIFMQWQ
jgi:hypothetical protein